MRKRIEYKKGERLGKCTFIKDVNITKPSDKRPTRRAVFKCDCGMEFIARISGIKNMNRTSCGCGLYKSTSLKHGLYNHSLYKKWVSIRSRCYDKNNTGYKYYGGRGITMCDEWRNDFKSFYDHVTQLPNYGEPGMTLDREDNDGNYEPGNVRWADMHVQSANKRHSLGGVNARGVNSYGNKYVATICVRRNNIKLGVFSTIKEAVQARNQYILDNNLTGYPIQKVI
jgi:hypothetical protein